MKHPLATTFALAVLAGISLVCKTSASVTIDWITVGNAGNAADPTTGYGAVNYEYQIGKYEVTNAQYAVFLNAKASTDTYWLYHPFMSGKGIARSGENGSYTYSVTMALANHPVVYVSWFNAARFSNWLANGQGNGDTETGSYTLNGATSGIYLANTTAKVYIPTENEWYKAAYYNGETDTYSLYPNAQNTITIADANYADSIGSSTNVGSYGSAPSFYGTFDQGGNVWEYNDAVIARPEHLMRGLRGGSSLHDESGLASYTRDSVSPTNEDGFNGFRVASIPEPSATFLTMLASGMMLIRRKR
jgi:sulfatase modifying factor 1